MILIPAETLGWQEEESCVQSQQEAIFQQEQRERGQSLRKSKKKKITFRFFKKGSCQLLVKVCARSTG